MLDKKLKDYLPVGENAFAELFGITKCHKKTCILINLGFPTFELDHQYDRFFMHWLEQMDPIWIVKQATHVYPKPILVTYEASISDSFKNLFPDNVSFVQWNTWGIQISLSAQHAGLQKSVSIPKYKFSSLAFRYSQYKKFITSFMLTNIKHADMILSWHNKVGKSEDLHSHPAGFSHLDVLDFSILNQKYQLNFKDDFDWDKNIAIDNTIWSNGPGDLALVTLTNESFHYSRTIINDVDTIFPGPYLTEKTWKPLISGKPFIAVGGCYTLQELEKLGLRTDFGWNKDYDLDCGDLTRIGKIFETILEINSQSIEQLYWESLPAVKHNLDWISSGELVNRCNLINQPQKEIIEGFVSNY